MLLFELEYMNKLHCVGWNSAAVITSVSSSIFAGLMSTISLRTVNTAQLSHPGIRTEALIANIQVPKIDPKVIGGDVSLLVRVHRNGVYVVCVCI